jgi:hypothetical protein
LILALLIALLAFLTLLILLVLLTLLALLILLLLVFVLLVHTASGVEQESGLQPQYKEGQKACRAPANALSISII